MRKHWSHRQLRDLIEIRHGYAFESEFYATQGEHVLLTPGNFREEGGFRWLGEKQKFYLGPVPDGYLLHRGQMLIAMTEQGPGLLGSTLFVPGDKAYLHNQRLGLIQVKDPDQISSEYLHYFFATSATRNTISAQSAGTKVKHTSPDKLLSLEIALPSLIEQRKIAAVIKAWDEMIGKVEALRAAKLRRLYGVAQGLLARTRAIGLDLDRPHWAPCTLGDVFRERQDRNVDLQAEDVVTVGKYAIRKQSEHFTRSVASADLSNYWIISPGDFVYDPMSAYYGAVGRYAGTSDGLVSPAYRVLRLNKGVSPEFVEHLLRSHHMRFLFEARSSQGNRDGKRRLLQRDEFGSIEFMMPPEPEQTRIAETLADFRRDVAQTERLLDRLENQKRGLMQKLLTGEWRVPC